MGLFGIHSQLVTSFNMYPDETNCKTSQLICNRAQCRQEMSLWHPNRSRQGAIEECVSVFKDYVIQMSRTGYIWKGLLSR